MTVERTKHKRNATTTGSLLGALIGAAALVLTAAALIGGPGNALKPFVAVWLAALPVIGFGALFGWLLAFALAGPGRGHRAGQPEL
jgi:hypothetical protein